MAAALAVRSASVAWHCSSNTLAGRVPCILEIAPCQPIKWKSIQSNISAKSATQDDPLATIVTNWGRNDCKSSPSNNQHVRPIAAAYQCDFRDGKITDTSSTNTEEHSDAQSDLWWHQNK